MRGTKSLSLRRAWIEIDRLRFLIGKIMSLSLRRAWIEITRIGPARQTTGRSPYGERGLKSLGDWPSDWSDSSLSLRRAWIEIFR